MQMLGHIPAKAVKLAGTECHKAKLRQVPSEFERKPNPDDSLRLAHFGFGGTDTMIGVGSADE
jgi:hypothetical protein